MAKIKSLRQKLENGNFSDPYSLGADAKNIDLAEGVNLEEKVADITKNIGTKAPINHASPDKTYGVGTAANYGHLKISDDYTKEGTDSSNTAVSQKGIVGMLNQYSNSLATKAPTNHASPNKTYGVGDEDNYGHLKISNTFNIEGIDSENTALSQRGAKALLDQCAGETAKKAPINHASPNTTYGVGTQDNYGHLKIINDWTYDSPDSESTAISQKGAYWMYNKYVSDLMGKAPNDHSSAEKTYGVGTANKYGHLKITDDYTVEGTDSSNTAISQKGIVSIFNQYLKDLEGKAPIDHAFPTTTYGAGTSDLYGHLKISDTFKTEVTASTSTALSQKGAVAMYNQHTTDLATKAPTNHASTAKTYGVGTGTNYGHLKISDDCNAVGVDSSSTAFSQFGAAAMLANNQAALANKAPTNHASSDTVYGVGDEDNYGHLKIRSDWNNETTNFPDEYSTAISFKAIKQIYQQYLQKISSINVVDNNGDQTLKITRIYKGPGPSVG